MSSKEIRRTEIMEAAIELFTRQGFHAAKVKDIAATAAIGKGTVYEYFPSKQHLFHDSLEYLLVLYNDGLKHTLAGAVDLRAGLSAFVAYQRSAYERSVSLIQSLAAVPISLTEELKRLWERQQSETLVTLENFLLRVIPGEPRFSGAEFPLAATLIYGAINQYCLQCILTEKSAGDDQEALRALTGIIEYGLRGGRVDE